MDLRTFIGFADTIFATLKSVSTTSTSVFSTTFNIIVGIIPTSLIFVILENKLKKERIN